MKLQKVKNVKTIQLQKRLKYQEAKIQKILLTDKLKMQVITVEAYKVGKREEKGGKISKVANWEQEYGGDVDKEVPKRDKK